ncbi:MAG: glycosyl hydrolase family 43, partial [Silvibacterium sp.]
PSSGGSKGQWYLIYHTADAKNGGHFRRSVAIDKLQWDDTVTPPRMLKVIPTHAPSAPPAPSRNIAAAARPSASNEPVPQQYWIAAVNDGIVRANPLPPDMWATWTPHNPPQQWLEYTWAKPVTLNGSRIVFWADHPAGANEGVAPPKAWHLEYWHHGAWGPVPHPSASTAEPSTQESHHPAAISFDPVTTRCLRAVFDASGDNTQHAAVAVEEWETLAPKPIAHSDLPAPPAASAGCSETQNH